MATGNLPGEPMMEGSGPLRVLDVPPAPVRDPRGGVRAGIVALVGVAAVIAFAVIVAQLAPTTPDRPRPAPPTPALSAAVVGPPATATPSPEPDASAIIADTPPRLSREDLVTQVQDGTLEGRLVFVDGAIRVTPVPCRSLAEGSTGCVDLEIPGVGLAVSADDVAIPWPGDPPPGAWLVTVARSGRLAYLGSLVPSKDAVSIGQLTGDLLGYRLDAPPTSLFGVKGFLVARSVWPCTTGTAAPTICPPLSRFLANDAPNADGSLSSQRGAAVSVAAAIPGVDRRAVVTQGTFLVTLPGDATCRPGHVERVCSRYAVTWEVVARYEPSQSVRVLVP